MTVSYELRRCKFRRFNVPSYLNLNATILTMNAFETFIYLITPVEVGSVANSSYSLTLLYRNFTKYKIRAAQSKRSIANRPLATIRYRQRAVFSILCSPLS